MDSPCGKTLLTKDGRITGNAICLNLKPKKVYQLITDYGNPLELTLREIHELFYIGKRVEADHIHFDHIDKVK